MKLLRKRLTWTDSLEDRNQAVPMQFGLTEERVREIVREEMARSVPDLRVVVGSGGTVRVVRAGQTIRRTPGSAGTLRP